MSALAVLGVVVVVAMAVVGVATRLAEREGPTATDEHCARIDREVDAEQLRANRWLG